MSDIPELNDDMFWTLIATANQDDVAFRKKLESLSRVELIGFSWKFKDLMGRLYEVMDDQNELSEDELEDLVAWIVARGKEFYRNVLDNPKQMPKKANYDEPGLDTHFQAIKVYYDRFGEHIPAYPNG